jgi:hypothetical protein
MVSAGGDEAAEERRMFAKFDLWDALFPCASLNLGISAVFCRSRCSPADLRRRLDPLARKTPPLNVLPPRKTRFGSPLVLSCVH